MSPIESTLKHRDVEETIDLYFYRPLGYGLSRLLLATPVTPNAVTVASMVVGVLGGHLFFYRDLWLNGLGMALVILSSLLDSTDGQLARMKGVASRVGRLLDGWADGVVFASIYLHLALRLLAGGAGAWDLALAAAAGLSQGLQNAMADYYRNAYLALAVRERQSELDSSDDARRMYQASRGAGWLERLLLRFYVGYTTRQERVSPGIARLSQALAGLPDSDPRREQARARYRELNRPLLRHLGWIATNFRTLLLFGLVLIGDGTGFLWLSVTALNLILAAVVLGHERNSRTLLAELG